MGVKFNGTDLESTYGFIHQNTEGLGSPRIRKSVVTIPGVHGSLDFGGTYEERDIYLVGYVSASSHANMLANLQALHGALAAVPLGINMAPINGMPLSKSSQLGTLELPDFTDRHFPCIFNGTFDVTTVGHRQLDREARVRIGFRQPQPWAVSNTATSASGATDTDGGYFNVSNDNGLHVPALISLEAVTDTVSSFSIYNLAVDPFVTKSITGTIGGTPAFRATGWTNGIIIGGIDFQAGTDYITYPLGGVRTLSQESGTIEMNFIPGFAASANSAVLWTMYVSATEYWRIYYDHTANRFKFQMVDGGTTQTVDSGVAHAGISTQHYIVVKWETSSASISVNGSAFVNGTQEKISYPSTMRLGSFGDDTLPADGVIDEFIIWNRAVNQAYVNDSWSIRRTRSFGRPVPGVLLYASFDFNPNAVGAGDKVFTYVNDLEVGDILFVDMERQTVEKWDVSTATKTNTIQYASNHFFDLVPGNNTFRIPKSGAGELSVRANFTKRYLI